MVDWESAADFCACDFIRWVCPGLSQFKPSGNHFGVEAGIHGVVSAGGSDFGVDAGRQPVVRAAGGVGGCVGWGVDLPPAAAVEE
jgi:hypothetical protein